MKRKLLIGLLSAISISACAVAFSACGGFGKHHEHKYEVYEVIAPTCSREGYTVYKCSCGRDKHDDFVQTLPHNYEDYVCSVCGSVSESAPGVSDLVFELDFGGYEYTVKGFKANATVTDLKIPSYYNGKEVTGIEREAFKDCTAIEKITVGYGVNRIAESAFSGCTNVTSLNLPEDIGIRELAFKNCTSITSLTMPKGSNFDNGSFSGCTSLQSVILPEDFGWLYKTYYHAFSGCTSLTAFSISSDNERYSTVDGVLFNKDKTELIDFPKGKSGEYTVPASVTSIGDSAFSGCGKLTKIILPDNLTKIGESVFNNCFQLGEIKIPESVTEIGDSAFWLCSGLESVTIPAGVSVINEDTFRYCRNLKNITLPASITTINKDAFYDCDKLETIDFKGTAAQWNAIDKKDSWDSYTGEYVIKCTDYIINKPTE
ncbi:MAG: leucine-rich repeat domain-containing protein [Clostridia bacterium]|nr:leucine-rich repeat domain-containing protein [Clostridia bacterium]